MIFAMSEIFPYDFSLDTFGMTATIFNSSFIARSVFRAGYQFPKLSALPPSWFD